MYTRNDILQSAGRELRRYYSDETILDLIETVDDLESENAAETAELLEEMVFASESAVTSYRGP